MSYRAFVSSKMNKSSIAFPISAFSRSNTLPVHGNNKILNGLYNADPTLLVFNIPNLMSRLHVQDAGSSTRDTSESSAITHDEVLQELANNYKELNPSNQVTIVKLFSE